MDDVVNDALRYVVAIIPARGGSKSIPRKNIKLLAGVPLIAYSIEAGLQAKRVDRVIVSTDDDEIAAVARKYGAEVPFMRPAALAEDTTLDLPVFQHAVEWLTSAGYTPDIVVQLRPTSPFRPLTMVDEAVKLLHDHAETDSVRGVVPSGQNPYKMWRMNGDGTMRGLLDDGTLLEQDGSQLSEPYNMPRQSLPETYWQTGHIDAIRANVIRAGSMSGRTIRPLLIESRFTIDIDTLLDWERAEWMLARLNLPVVRPPTRSLFARDVRLLALDFDGTLTDDRVWVNADGVESVAAHRGDGMGISMIKEAGIEVVVISRETNPVVAARCRKLGVVFHQGILGKKSVLDQLVADRGLHYSQVAYMGNDVNDLECLRLVGLSAAPSDAHPEVLQTAHWVSVHRGGHGAVRDLCDHLLAAMERKST